MRWIQKISEFVRSQPDVFRFLVFGFGGYIVWHLTYEEYLKPATLLDEYVTQHLIISTEWVMESLGYLVNAYFQATDGLFRTRVGIAGAAGVFVGPSCDGVVSFCFVCHLHCILSRALDSESVVHPAGDCCDSCGQCLSNHLLAVDSIVFRRRCHDIQSRLHLHGVCVQHHFLVVVPLRGERRGGKTVDAFHGRKRTSAVNRVSKPMLPRKRPFWLLVLAVMLVFGFYQEKAKIQLNHYTQVMEANPELEAMPSEMRAQWWQNHPQPRRIHYYIMQGTWSGFHGMSRTQLGRLKWAMSLVILVVFFALDGLCSRRPRGIWNGGLGWWLCTPSQEEL